MTKKPEEEHVAGLRGGLTVTNAEDARTKCAVSKGYLLQRRLLVR